MIDDRTLNLSLPLPHIENLLEVDVARIREAFIAIDAKLAEINATLQSDDPALSSVQQIVTKLKTISPP